MHSTSNRAAALGLAAALLLIAAAVLVPPLTGWQVWARADGSPSLPPLHGYWHPEVGPGTVPAVLIAVVGWRWAAALADRLEWKRLLALCYLVGLAWLLSLALVDGPRGISGVLGTRNEYLRTARSVTSVHHLLQTYVSRIPFSAGPARWPVHVAGHPPGMLLFFVALVHLGLGGNFAAGAVVTVIAATTALAAMTTLRVLGHECAARTAAPYLVLTPAAVFMAVSADAVMAATVAWGLACLALAARTTMRRGWCWAISAGLLLGAAVMMSYGLPTAGLLALGVLVVARRWWPLPVAAAASLAVVLAFAAGGFSWWHAYPVLVHRYWGGLAARRPASYWMWGNLAALAISAGPAVGAGLASMLGPREGVARRRDDAPAVLAVAAVLAILVADVSRMSKAEVERIWLPFVPWLTLCLVALPRQWRRRALAVQLLTALVLQHLLHTAW